LSKTRDALSPLLFKFALEYAIKKVQENQLGLRLYGIDWPLIYTDDVNLLGNNINTTEKCTESFVLVNASEEIGIEVNAEKTKYR
jgi:hypothetical protein